MCSKVFNVRQFRSDGFDNKEYILEHAIGIIYRVHLIYLLRSKCCATSSFVAFSIARETIRLRLRYWSGLHQGIQFFYWHYHVCILLRLRPSSSSSKCVLRLI